MSDEINKVFILSCDAIDCKHNKNKKCNYEEPITINSDFECEGFDQMGDEDY